MKFETRSVNMKLIENFAKRNWNYKRVLYVYCISTFIIYKYILQPGNLIFNANSIVKWISIVIVETSSHRDLIESGFALPLAFR